MKWFYIGKSEFGHDVYRQIIQLHGYGEVYAVLVGAALWLFVAAY